MNFGCFVQMEGLKKKWEGLVHISQVFSIVFPSDYMYFELKACLWITVHKSS